MIQITHTDGRQCFVAAPAIARITEAGTSSQWHGTRAIVKLFDGEVIEAQETVTELIQRIEREGAPKP